MIPITCACCGFEIDGPLMYGSPEGPMHQRCAEYLRAAVRATADEREAWVRFAAAAIARGCPIAEHAADWSDAMLVEYRKRWGREGERT